MGLFKKVISDTKEVLETTLAKERENIKIELRAEEERKKRSQQYNDLKPLCSTCKHAIIQEYEKWDCGDPTDVICAEPFLWEHRKFLINKDNMNCDLRFVDDETKECYEDWWGKKITKCSRYQKEDRK